MNRIASMLAALLLGASSLANAAEPATVALATELRELAFSNGTVIMPLPAGSSVSILARSGAWAQVSVAGSGGKTGWVRLLSLRTVAAPGGDSGVGTLLNVFKTGSSGQAVATGVKGLSAAELAGAKPSQEQLEKLSTYQVPVEEARAGAARMGLEAKNVPYLPSPAVSQK